MPDIFASTAAQIRALLGKGRWARNRRACEVNRETRAGGDCLPNKVERAVAVEIKPGPYEASSITIASRAMAVSALDASLPATVRRGIRAAVVNDANMVSGTTVRVSVSRVLLTRDDILPRRREE